MKDSSEEESGSDNSSSSSSNYNQFFGNLKEKYRKPAEKRRKLEVNRFSRKVEDAENDESGEESSSESIDSPTREKLNVLERELNQPKVLPPRITRGRRFNKLLGDAAEADEQFWKHDTWEEEAADQEWSTENEGNYKDIELPSSESDISSDEDEETLMIQEKAIEKEERLNRQKQKQKTSYKDPRKRGLKATKSWVSEATASRPKPPPPAKPHDSQDYIIASKARGSKKNRLLSQEDHLEIAAKNELENKKHLADVLSKESWKKAMREMKQATSIWSGNMVLMISWASNRLIEAEEEKKKKNREKEVLEFEKIYCREMIFFVNFDEPIKSCIPATYTRVIPMPPKLRYCSINSDVPARYKDPRSNEAFSDAYAYSVLQERQTESNKKFSDEITRLNKLFCNVLNYVSKHNLLSKEFVIDSSFTLNEPFTRNVKEEEIIFSAAPSELYQEEISYEEEDLTSSKYKNMVATGDPTAVKPYSQAFGEYMEDINQIPSEIPVTVMAQTPVNEQPQQPEGRELNEECNKQVPVITTQDVRQPLRIRSGFPAKTSYYPPPFYNTYVMPSGGTNVSQNSSNLLIPGFGGEPSPVSEMFYQQLLPPMRLNNGLYGQPPLGEQAALSTSIYQQQQQNQNQQQRNMTNEPPRGLNFVSYAGDAYKAQYPMTHGVTSGDTEQQHLETLPVESSMCSTDAMYRQEKPQLGSSGITASNRSESTQPLGTTKLMYKNSLDGNFYFEPQQEQQKHQQQQQLQEQKLQQQQQQQLQEQKLQQQQQQQLQLQLLQQQRLNFPMMQNALSSFISPSQLPLSSGSWVPFNNPFNPEIKSLYTVQLPQRQLPPVHQSSLHMQRQVPSLQHPELAQHASLFGQNPCSTPYMQSVPQYQPRPAVYDRSQQYITQFSDTIRPPPQQPQRNQNQQSQPPYAVSPQQNYQLQQQQQLFTSMYQNQNAGQAG